MSFINSLNLIDAVGISRETMTSDGMGGFTSTTTTVTLGRAAIWSAGGNKSYLSDQLMAVSSHVLACLPSADVLYTDTVTYDGENYEITGHPDDILQKGTVKIVPLKKVN